MWPISGPCHVARESQQFVLSAHCDIRQIGVPPHAPAPAAQQFEIGANRRAGPQAEVDAGPAEAVELGTDMGFQHLLHHDGLQTSLIRNHQPPNSDAIKRPPRRAANSPRRSAFFPAPYRKDQAPPPRIAVDQNSPFSLATSACRSCAFSTIVGGLACRKVVQPSGLGGQPSSRMSSPTVDSAASDPAHLGVG